MGPAAPGRQLIRPWRLTSGHRPPSSDLGVPTTAGTFGCPAPRRPRAGCVGAVATFEPATTASAARCGTLVTRCIPEAEAAILRRGSLIRCAAPAPASLTTLRIPGTSLAWSAGSAASTGATRSAKSIPRPRPRVAAWSARARSARTRPTALRALPTSGAAWSAGATR
jgi:hypothetical protein